MAANPALKPAGARKRLSYPVIDADGHVEPAIAADWTKLLPAPYGQEYTRYAHARYRAARHSDLKRTGASDPRARLADMDAEGIDIAVLFGSTTGLSTQDLERPIEVSHGYNDWLAEYCKANSKRLKGIAMVPLADIDAARKELRRAVTQLGFVGTVVQASFKDKGADDPYFHDLYAEVQSLGVPLMIHIGHAVRPLLTREFHLLPLREHALGAPFSMMLAVMDILYGGILEKFTELRVAFLEGMAGWLPWWLDRLDADYERLPHEAPLLTKKPSDYLEPGRFFISCEPDEAYLSFVVNTLGEDFVVYSSDYPHWDSIYPGAVKALLDQPALTERQKQKILSDNALTLLYGKTASAGNR